MSKQMTLGAFGFTKSIVHRGQEERMGIPLSIDATVADKRVECSACHERFFN